MQGVVDFCVRPAHLSRETVPDALFATDNDLGIPCLDPRLQAQYCELPVMTWGSVRRTTDMAGTWHFFTDDTRFRALWSDPTPVINSGCVAAVEPNFTTSEQMPPAVAHYQIYKKRWLARYWQTQGVKVWVDLNVAFPWAQTNLLGVPYGWRAYMTRGYSDRLDDLEAEFDLACRHAWTGEILFAVYGGGEAVRQYCQRRALIWLEESADIRKGKYRHE
jgi:hypothetical protein